MNAGIFIMTMTAHIKGAVKLYAQAPDVISYCTDQNQRYSVSGLN